MSRLAIALALISVGTASALLATRVTFREQLISNKYGYAFGLAAADLDKDGDLDFTSADAVRNSLSWYENDGHGKFTRHKIRANESGWFERHELADVDNDGHLDIVVVKNLHNDIVWFRNPGSRLKKWSRHIITSELPSAYDVAVADLDGDGDLDVAASSWIRGNRFTWYENNGKPAAGPWKARLIASHLNETREVIPADFDKDGDVDLLGTATKDNLLVWFENSGKRSDAPWKQHVISRRHHRPVHGAVIDMDKDGDADIVMAFGSFTKKLQHLEDSHRIIWFENLLGKWRPHLVCKLINATECVASDLDGDGDLDVVASAWGAQHGQLIWAENIAGGTKWRTHVLKKRWPKANSIIAGDFNGDRRIDIIATAERGSNEVRAWINLGR